MFAKRAAGWKQVAELRGSDTIAFGTFGTSVAISGNTAVNADRKSEHLLTVSR